MSSPRVRRLKSDYERVTSRFINWPLVKVEFVGGGLPPDTYRINYDVKGLYTGPNGQILERNDHTLEIKLGLDYPRRPPQLRLLTPLFHPNFNQTEVCAQDIYAASEGLDNLIIRIGRMIAYQVYNTKSPLNGIAGKWAAENSHRFPVDERDIAPPASDDKNALTPPPIPGQLIQPSGDKWTPEIVITIDEVMSGDNKERAGRGGFDCPGCGIQLIEKAIDNMRSVLVCPKCQTSITIASSSQNAWHNDSRWLCMGFDDDGATYYLDEESILNDGDGFRVSLRAIPSGNQSQSDVPPGTAYVFLIWKIYSKRNVLDILSFQFFDAKHQLLSTVPCQMLKEIGIKPNSVGEKTLNYVTGRLR